MIDFPAKMARILVLDDDRTYCRTVSIYLSRAGHEVTSLDDGLVVMRSVVRHTVDLILLDLSMPKMDGEVFLEVLRSQEEWRWMPVIIVTSTPQGEKFERAKALGIQGAFDKTKLNYFDLLSAIDRVLLQR
jgi:CheY-like chemotaxis protein